MVQHVSGRWYEIARGYVDGYEVYVSGPEHDGQRRLRFIRLRCVRALAR